MLRVCNTDGVECGDVVKMVRRSDDSSIRRCQPTVPLAAQMLWLRPLIQLNPMENFAEWTIVQQGLNLIGCQLNLVKSESLRFALHPLNPQVCQGITIHPYRLTYPSGRQLNAPHGQ